MTPYNANLSIVFGGLNGSLFKYKNMSQDRVIELCSRNGGNPELFDEIIERCILTDPKLIEMAKDAKAKIAQK